MASGDVAYFVTDDAGELSLGVEADQQTAIDVDVAAAGGEGVDVLVIDDEKLEFLVRQVARERKARANLLHVFLRGLIVIEAERLDDFLVMFLDGFLFTVHRAEDDILATRSRIARAARREHAGRR